MNFKFCFFVVLRNFLMYHQKKEKFIEQNQVGKMGKIKPSFFKYLRFYKNKL